MGKLVQASRVTATNPLRTLLGPIQKTGLAVRVENPSGEAFRGVVRLVDAEGLRAKQPTGELVLAAGAKQADVAFPLEAAPQGEFRLGVRIEDEHERLVALVPTTRRALADDFSRYTTDTLRSAYQIVPDGDAKIGSEQSLAIADALPSLPGEATRVLKLTYQMDAGWKFLRLAPQGKTSSKIEGQPKRLGMWIYGDSSGDSPRLRFVDATGQTHQPSAESITWTGWRYVEFPLASQPGGHWGGADDGRVHYPIRWDSLFLLDSVQRKAHRGEISLASPVLIY
jgi:hypothetical protein